MTADITDHIERKTVLRAPRSRVWNAISDSKEFGEWFGVKLDGPFVAGQRLAGSMTLRGHEGMSFELWVDRIEPESLFSFRWHPNAIDPKVDVSAEPMTLVVFALSEAPEGTHLTITESGFEGVPLARRAQAFSSNSEGWTIQIEAVKTYVGG
jgi:uncharacterized protein YndB with AHSA1/START domain